MATITALPQAHAIELSTLNPQNAAPDSAASSTIAPDGSTQVDTASLASTVQHAVPAYFASSQRSGKQLTQSFLKEPMLLTKTGQTVEKGQASRRSQVPNKVLSEALAIYTASANPLALGADWHSIVDPISLDAPTLAVQVVSSYRDYAPQTGETTDYQEAHVYEMQNLLDWFKVSSKSPMSPGDIKFPIQIAANIAVSNLVRASLQPPKAPLTQAEQKAFATYCEQVSTQLNYNLKKPKPGPFTNRTTKAKVAAPFAFAAGIGSAAGLSILKNALAAKVHVPVKPIVQGFSYVGSYSYDTIAYSSQMQWALYGCDVAPGACDSISVYQSYINFSPAQNAHVFQTVTPTQLSGVALTNLCLTQQATCAGALNDFRSASKRVNTLAIGFDTAAAATVLMGVAAAALIWRYGVKKAPQMPTLHIASDEV